MKPSEYVTKSRLPIAIALAALIISSTSLGLQISRSNRSRFSNYMGSATISELDYRLLQAQLDIMRGELPIEDGFTPPLVYGLSADRQKVVVRILVFPKQLPAKYDDRRSAMLARGMLCTRSVLSWFHGGGISDSDVTVEFLDTDDSGKEKMLATYQGGQLAFH